MMIYNILIRNYTDGIQRQFYLSAESQEAVIKRACYTYNVIPEQITVVEYYKDLNQFEYDPVPIKVVSKQISINDKASEMFYGAIRKRGKKKLDYINKYNFSEIKISSPDDLAKLIGKYKQVKCYWESGDTRGEHQYYALYK